MGKSKVLNISEHYYVERESMTQDQLNEALLESCEKGGDINKVASLIEAGADVNAQNEYGASPLHWAAHHNNQELAEILIAHNANINAQTKHNLSPLYWGAFYSSISVVTTLLKAHFGKFGMELHPSCETIFNNYATKIIEAVRDNNPFEDILAELGEAIEPTNLGPITQLTHELLPMIRMSVKSQHSDYKKTQYFLDFDHRGHGELTLCKIIMKSAGIPYSKMYDLHNGAMNIKGGHVAARLKNILNNICHIKTTEEECITQENDYEMSYRLHIKSSTNLELLPKNIPLYKEAEICNHPLNHTDIKYDSNPLTFDEGYIAVHDGAKVKQTTKTDYTSSYNIITVRGNSYNVLTNRSTRIESVFQEEIFGNKKCDIEVLDTDGMFRFLDQLVDDYHGADRFLKDLQPMEISGLTQILWEI